MKEYLQEALHWSIAFVLQHKANTAIAVIAFILGSWIF